MRISPKSLSPAEALAKAKATAKANAQTRDDARRETLETEAAEASAPKTSPAEIDARRAQQLLERAAALGARGDMGAAVLATRQSLALAPDNVEGHLLHARLLERNRDFGGARAAYQKSVELAPERADASENLTRLNLYLEQSQGAARQFQFDSDELFAPITDGAPSNGAPSDPSVEAASESAPVTSADAALLQIDSMEMFDESMLPSIEARLPPTRGAAGAVETPSAVQAQVSEVSEIGAPEHAAAGGAAVAPAAPSGEGDRRKHNIPVATERRRRPAGVAAVVAPTVVMAPVEAREPVASRAPVVAAMPIAAPVPLRPGRASDAIFDLDQDFGAGVNTAPPRSAVPLTLDVPAAPTGPLWQQIVARPSFYARALPLLGVAVLSLGFLSWARGRAVSQVVAPAPTELAQTQPAPTDSTAQPATVPGTTLPLPNSAASGNSAPATNGGGFPISNAPATFQAPPATNAAPPNSGNGATSANDSAPQTTARASNSGSNRANDTRPRNTRRVLPPARPVPSFPSVSLAPAPIPPASARGTSANSAAGQSGGNIILPSPTIDFPAAPAPRQRVLPPSDNGLNPSGSPNRGYVRITEGRVGNGVIPVQPSGAARQNESDANEAARNGQTDQAISQLSQAIRADSENAGFRYQQRATLFLQRGDYSRASDDFQAAISAYQNQINNGTDVAQAKRGLSSARSGLNLALAGKRG